MRTGGAQSLAGLGVDPIRIQAMGRWKSGLVIRYSGSRGSTGITRDAARGLKESRSSCSAAPPVQLALPNIAPALDSSLDSLADAQRLIDSALHDSHDHAHEHMLNTVSGVYHKFRDGRTKTLCGLSFSKWKGSKCAKLPDSAEFRKMCSRCCRPERNELREGEVSTESSDA